MKIEKEFVEENLSNFDITPAVYLEKVEEVGEKYRELNCMNSKHLKTLAETTDDIDKEEIGEDFEVMRATENAFMKEDVVEKVEELVEIEGVDTVGATWILVALNPDKYAVVNREIQEVLVEKGVLQEVEELTPKRYKEILSELEKINDKIGYTVSDISYALYLYRYEEGENK